MAKIPLYSAEGEEMGGVEASDSIFSVEPKTSVVHAYVKAYWVNQSQGTVATKGRSEVRGGGAKPWRQKGTGRARAGTTSSPIWVGGGRAFARNPHQKRVRLPRKTRRLALKAVLSDRLREGAIRMVKEMALDEARTKAMVSILQRLNILDQKCLLLVEQYDRNLHLACRNIPTVRWKRAKDVNAYDVLNCQVLLMTSGALTELEGVLG